MQKKITTILKTFISVNQALPFSQSLLFFLSHCFRTHMHTTLNLRQQDQVQLLSRYANVL